MALPSTVFKAELHISDMDRHYYETHNLTLARHPSETDERMMVRLLAFALNASENLAFAQGLSAPDEPDLWEKDLQGSIERWIMVGLPDEKQIKKAVGRSRNVIIYAYGGSAVDTWWEKSNLDKQNNLTVINVPSSISVALAQSAQRSMKIQCSIQDGIAWWNHENGRIEIQCNFLKKASR